MLGLFRVGTNPKAMTNGEAFTFSELWRSYEGFLALPELVFLDEPPTEAELRRISEEPKFKQVNWTDAYLVAFATCANCRLVSFDKGVQQLSNVAILLL